jgi:outer membrane protein OmpA-like peptidoglycan-associated protein
VLITPVYGQYHTKSKKAIKYFEKSGELLRSRNYSEAITYLEMAIEKDPGFAEAHLRLGTNYLSIGDHLNARSYLEEAVSLIPNDPKTIGAQLALAEMYYREGSYEMALKFLQKFKSFNPPPKMVKSAAKLEQNANFALAQIKNPLPFDPQPLPDNVNVYDLQYFPVLTADQNTLIFTRRRSRDPQFDEDMVTSSKNPDGSWSDPESISENINTKFNEGTCTISANGRTIIFTSCSGRSSMGSCDLYISYKLGDEWTDPENMGTDINSRNWESQPSLSADGRILYFVSDRTGGYGKRDIWKSHWVDGKWTKAVNLGATINTADEEVSPFIHVNGQTLYFSSKGFLGMGGYDIFYSEWQGGKWTAPKNLGYPINTADDQVSLFITADGKKGYYSYEQKGPNTYKSLLYDFQVPEAIRIKSKSNYIAGKVLNIVTKRPLRAQVELYDINADSLKSTVTSDSLTGDYLQILTDGSEYALYVSKTGYIFESLRFDYQESQDREPIHIDIFLKPIRSGTTSTMNNIFFDVDEYKIKQKSSTELNKTVLFLQTNPSIRIEIAGHTDNSGSDSHNQQLSLNRAKAVYEFLINQEINPKQLGYKGYGSTVPVAPNDSEENRQLNRRIEFRIL